MAFLLIMSILNLFVAYPKSFRKALKTTIGKLKTMYHARALRDVRSRRRSLSTFVISPREKIIDVMRKVVVWIDRYTEDGNRGAVEALRAVQRILVNYETVPNNGLIIYAGIVYTDDGSKIGVAIGFEPFKLIYAPSNRILDRFDTEALTRLLEPDNVITQAVGWVLNVITQARGWVRNVITQALHLVRLLVEELVVLLLHLVRLLVELVGESFVQPVELMVFLAAYSVQDHGWVQDRGWVQNVIFQALGWVQIFVLHLVPLVAECFLLLLDLVVPLVVSVMNCFVRLIVVVLAA